MMQLNAANLIQMMAIEYLSTGEKRFLKIAKILIYCLRLTLKSIFKISTGFLCFNEELLLKGMLLMLSFFHTEN